MKEYEILIETVNPCGGGSRDGKEIIEAACESPMTYVKTKSPYPIMETVEKSPTEILIITGDGKGGVVRYTFMAL